MRRTSSWEISAATSNGRRSAIHDTDSSTWSTVGPGRVGEPGHHRPDGRRSDREYHDGGDDDEDDRHRRSPCAKSDTDALREELAVIRRVTEQQLGRLGPLEVQMRRVLPREADTAVNLNVFGRRVEVGL